ncbi:MAG: SHOCT domain-containing protein [Actinocrinis sp.]
MPYWHDNGWMSGWGYLLMTIGMIVFWGVLICAAVVLFRHFPRNGQRHPAAAGGSPAARHEQSPEQILALRYARGEIDENEYATRLATLRGSART